MKDLFLVILSLSFLNLFNGCKSANQSPTSILNTQVFSVEDFGAIPNDGIDDSEAIQTAINEAIKSRKSSWVYCPPGIYDLYKGVVIANQRKNGEFTFVTLRLSGHQIAYSSNQRIGSTTVFRTKNKNALVLIQHARSCTIENIAFVGAARFKNKPKEILDFDLANAEDAKISINRYSPSSAIAIDPFHKSIALKDQYAEMGKWYKNASRAGSSMINITGCSFTKQYIAIANNPSGKVQNGDNIRATDCHASGIYTFWSAGQTQSRANSIENLYCLHVNTLISGTQIGQGNGTPPTLSNVSVAGFCKKLVDINTGFSGFSVYQSYFENLWSIGFARCNFVSFNQSQLKFYKPENQIHVPSIHLFANNVVSFNDCSIEFFSNCKYPIPIIFKATRVRLNGGKSEAGIILADCITNTGGEKLHNVSFDDFRDKCKGAVLSRNYSGVLLSNFKESFVPGTTRIVTARGEQLNVNKPTYDLQFVEAGVRIEKDDRGYFFRSKNPKQYKLNDNLLSDVWLEMKDVGLSKKIRPTLGFVERKVGNKIYINGVSKLINDLETNVYKLGYHVFNL